MWDNYCWLTTHWPDYPCQGIIPLLIITPGASLSVQGCSQYFYTFRSRRGGRREKRFFYGSSYVCSVSFSDQPIDDITPQLNPGGLINFISVSDLVVGSYHITWINLNQFCAKAGFSLLLILLGLGIFLFVATLSRHRTHSMWLTLRGFFRPRREKLARDVCKMLAKIPGHWLHSSASDGKMQRWVFRSAETAVGS